MKGKISVKPKKSLKENEIELIKRTKDNYTHEVIHDKFIEEITTWKTSKKKLGHYYLYNILTCGIINLITRYKPLLFIKLYYIPCVPKEADYFLVKDIYNEYTLCIKEIKRNNQNQYQSNMTINEDLSNEQVLGVTTNNKNNLNNHIIGFTYNSNFYEYNESVNKIIPIFFNLTYLSNRRIYQLFIDGLSTKSKVNRYKERYGLNICPFNLKIHIMYFLRVELTLLILSVIVALLESLFGNIFYFCLIIIFIILIIICQFILFKKNSLSQEFTLDGQNKKIKVKRRYLSEEYDEYCYINNIDLLPGDIIILKKDDNVPCDGIILEGECIITLSEVNGAISEIKKKQLSNNSNKFNYRANKNSILYHGTKILKSFSKLENNSILLLCINTGANTYKANQLINIIYLLKRSKSYSEIYSKFCGKKKKLFIYGLVIFILSIIGLMIVYFIIYKEDFKKIFNKKVLKIVLGFLSRCFIPCFHVVSSGIIFLGLIYLYKEKIMCFDKSRLLYAGSVNTIFFDKTGTLTESKLEINGFLHTTINSNSSEIFLKYYNINQIKDLTSLLINYYRNFQQEEKNYNENNSDSSEKEKKMNDIQKKMAVLFLECMVCCNDLEKKNNQIYGNSIEREIFSQIKWEMKINSEGNKKMLNNKHLFGENEEDSGYFNDNKQSNQTTNSMEEEDGNSSKYKIKSLEQKIDIYPNNYYKITEGKKKINNPNNNNYLENNLNTTNDLIIDSSGSKNDSEKDQKKYRQMNQILEDIMQNENNNSYKLRIYKRFIKIGTFHSSAIVYNPIMKTLHFMIKGLPEKILPNCNINYLPKDINKILALYRKNGCINLVLASKVISEFNYNKSNGEDYYMCDLIFCGIIILKNKLKKDVKQVIQQLQHLNCDLILNTGDNIYNSLTVSYESGIISKKNIYVFDLNKSTGKITIDDFSESSKSEPKKSIYNIDKISSNNLQKKTTNVKIHASRKGNLCNNKLEKINSILGKEKEKNNYKKLDDSGSKKNSINPYYTEKIKKLNNKETNIPQLKLDKMNNNNMNLSVKQELSSPRKRQNIRKQTNNALIDDKMSIDNYNPSINELLGKSNENQIDHFSNLSNHNNEKYLLATSVNSNPGNSSNNISFFKNANKARVSAVVTNINKNVVKENINRQNSKKQLEIYEGIKRKDTKVSWHNNNSSSSKKNIDYNPYKLRNMRNDCIYCVSGKALRFICENKFKPEFKKYEFPILLNHIKKFGKIFYEMKSEDKSFLIDFYRKIPNKITCMVGNGQNDIDAIMTSHVGININPPINYNTMLCHFNPTDGSLFCIEKIIRYGRVLYENIYLLGISSLLCSLIIIFYQIVLYIYKLEAPENIIDFLSCNCFLLSIFAFVVKPDITIKSSPLFNNPSLYRYFFILLVISNVIITIGFGILFLHVFSRNKENEKEKQDKIFGTYSYFFVYFQLVGTIFSINSINFYRLSYSNNYIFLTINIIILILISFIYCICGYSFHPFLYNYLDFEYSPKNVDIFDDKNKLLCFLVYIGNGLTYSFFVSILLFIFNKKAHNEQEENEKIQNNN